MLAFLELYAVGNDSIRLSKSDPSAQAWWSGMADADQKSDMSPPQQEGSGAVWSGLPSWGRSHVYPPMCCDHYFVSAHEQTEENMMDTEFKERFCEEVHGYLSLYMWSLKQYKNNKICTSSWMESA